MRLEKAMRRERLHRRNECSGMADGSLSSFANIDSLTVFFDKKVVERLSPC